MQEDTANCENGKTIENCENPITTTAEAKLIKEDGIGHDGNDANVENEDFNARILERSVTSVVIDWSLISHTEVYKIEKYHKRRGWERVAWTDQGPETIENLEENFAYRFRIKALVYDEEQKAFVDFKVSPDIVASTLCAAPTTLCLHRAIKKGQRFVVKRLLRSRPSLIDCPGPNGYLPLANAIICGDHYIVDFLLTAGASVHLGNPQNNRTPLHLAFYHGHLPLARILLNKKADLEAGDIYGMTACHFAIDANHCDILKFALENGANVEATDACGWTLLMRAVVMAADVNILKALVTHGADIKALDKIGKTCVDLARLYANTEAAQYFANLSKAKE